MDQEANVKFAKLHTDFRDLCPLYYFIYRAMEKVETEEIPTMGVTMDKFYYNKSFVERLTYPEFLFVVAHEMCHVALMHPLRLEGKDHRLVNIACDLYVNKFVMEDVAQRYYSKTGIEISMPSSDVIKPIYDPNIDINRDTVEEIYDRLHKQAENNGYLADSDENSNQEYTFHTPGGKTFRTKKDEKGDIIPESGTDEIEKKRQLKRILTKAVSESRMIGTDSSMLSRAVEGILKSNFDWREWLLKYCIKAKSTDLTFSHPDKRMYYIGKAIYPGQVMDEPNELRNVKVCIDTSGSVWDEDLRYFLGHILRLTEQYKVSAEVIAWDTRMCVVGKLTKNTGQAGLEKMIAQLKGGGGTDPTCLFQYFDSPECREKPLVTLIFTDGYINFTCNPKWKRKYKDTIWILSQNGKGDFQPPFGKKANVKCD